MPAYRHPDYQPVAHPGRNPFAEARRRDFNRPKRKSVFPHHRCSRQQRLGCLPAHQAEPRFSKTFLLEVNTSCEMPRRLPATAGVGFPGRCPPARRLWGGWCGRSRRSRASLSLQLARIALYLCDPPLNKLKGANCGPVSQTRVCEPPRKGDSSTWTAPELTRSWSEGRPVQVPPPGQAGRNQPPNVRDLPPTRPTCIFV